MDPVTQTSGTAPPAGRVHFDERLRPGSLTWVSPAPEIALEDHLVKTAFGYLVSNHVLGAPRARELGRALGRVAREGQLAPHLAAFSHLGLGSLRLVSAEKERYSFAGSNLVGSAEAPNAVACALALGYAEGVAEGISGRATLGSEMACRSRGHAECVFVVRAR